MRAIAPRTGAPEVTFAEEQQEYSPITVAVYLLAGEYAAGGGDPRALLTRWTFSAAERAAIAAGEDVYVSQINFNYAPMTPINVEVGAGNWVPT